MIKYELQPRNGQKSFYGKAYTVLEKDGSVILYSYDTPIIKRLADGTLLRLWGGWSATTGKHIKSFCGLRKAEFLELELKYEKKGGYWHV